MMTGLKSYCLLLKNDLRFFIPPALMSALFLLLLISQAAGLNNLSLAESSAVLEKLTALLGILLFTPTFYPEQDLNIRDLTASKYISQTRVGVLRLLLRSCLLLLLISLFMGAMKCLDSAVCLGQLWGTLATALFLGGLGIFTARICNNVIIGYMISFLYYILNLFMKPAQMGYLYLFSMQLGDYSNKLWLFLGGLVLLSLSLTKRG